MPETEGTIPITFMNDNRRRVRLLIGLTLDDLAQLTEISKSALSKWECGLEPLAMERQLLVDRTLRRELARHALEVCAELDRIGISDMEQVEKSDMR